MVQNQCLSQKKKFQLDTQRKKKNEIYEGA